MYSLGGTDLQTIGFTPIIQDGSDVALSGFFDMPARLGKTFHIWANENGIEPYVSAADIANGGYAGRNLVLPGVITGNSQYDVNDKLSALYSLIDNFTAPVTLLTDWGSYLVVVNAAVVGEKLSAEGVRVTLTMRETNVDISGTAPTGNGSQYSIDGISYQAFGGYALLLSGDRFNRTATKGDKLTVYGKEQTFIGKKEPATLQLKLVLTDTTVAGLKAKVYNLMALFKKPGLRTLTYEGDKPRSFFVKDGFEASNIHLHTDLKLCIIEAKLLEVPISLGAITNLTNKLGQTITDNNNNIITVRL